MVIKNKSERQFVGCEDLRQWLLGQGFLIGHSGSSQFNDCNWYAYRRSKITARECECNDGKAMQLVVTPHLWQSFTSVCVDVTGEAGGKWFKLQAYGLSNQEFCEHLGDIETSLIAAWNALLTDNQTRPGCDGIPPA